MNFLKYSYLFLVLYSNSINEVDDSVEKLKEQFRDISESHKILNHDLENKIKKIGNLEQTNSELTARCINAESESKRFKEENKELKNPSFLPKTAKGWAGLGLILLGTFVVARIYYTLYMT